MEWFGPFFLYRPFNPYPKNQTAWLDLKHIYLNIGLPSPERLPILSTDHDSLQFLLLPLTDAQMRQKERDLMILTMKQ